MFNLDFARGIRARDSDLIQANRRLRRITAVDAFFADASRADIM